MRIGIVTWYNNGNNYGQTLQAFALNYVLSLWGHYVEDLDYIATVRPRRSKVKRILSNISCKKSELQKAFDAFVNKRILHSKALYGIDEVERYITKNKFDILICGSDQIWNPNNFDKFYYLGVSNDVKRVAYAVSISDKRYMGLFNNIPEVCDLMRHLDAISVREKSGAEIVKTLIGVMPQTVLDPTLLITGAQWKNILGLKDQCDTKYIFCYMFNVTDTQKSIIDECAEKRGNIHVIYSAVIMQELDRDREDIKKNSSIEEFLELISNAEMIFTDSFHGTAFSILFHKDFYVFDNGADEESDPYYNIDRIVTLLSILDLERRLIQNKESVSTVDTIDYNVIEMLLSEKRAESEEFLRNAIDP